MREAKILGKRSVKARSEFSELRASWSQLATTERVERLRALNLIDKRFSRRAIGWVKSNGEACPETRTCGTNSIRSPRSQIQWEWIAGHGDHPDQNRADQLALQAARSQAAQGVR